MLMTKPSPPQLEQYCFVSSSYYGEGARISKSHDSIMVRGASAGSLPEDLRMICLKFASNLPQTP